MARYTKWSEEFDAIQYGPATDEKFLEEFQDDVSDFLDDNLFISGDGRDIEIDTLDGEVLTATEGDWIVRSGTTGEIAVVKPDEFARDYHPAL